MTAILAYKLSVTHYPGIVFAPWDATTCIKLQLSDYLANFQSTNIGNYISFKWNPTHFLPTMKIYSVLFTPVCSLLFIKVVRKKNWRSLNSN